MIKHCGCTILVLFCCMVSFGQVDSLKALMNDELKDSQKADLFLEISSQYRIQGKLNRDSLYKYSSLAIEALSQMPVSEKMLTAKTFRLVAQYHETFSTYDSLAKDLIKDCYELDDYYKAINEEYYIIQKAYVAGHLNLQSMISSFQKNLEKHKHHIEEHYNKFTVKSLGLLASFYSDRGEYEKAIDNSLEAVRLSELNSDSTVQLSAYRNISGVLGNLLLKRELTNDVWLNERSRLKKYLFKTFELAKELGINSEYSLACSNLTNFYLDVDSFNMAKKYALMALEVENLSSLYQHSYEANLLLSIIEKNLGNLSLAESYLTKAGESALKTNSEKIIFWSNIEKTNFYLDLKQYDRVSDILKRINTNVLRNPELKKTYYDKLAILNLELGNYEAAYHHRVKFYELKDSLEDLSNQTKIATLLSNFDKIESERKLAIAETEKTQLKSKIQLLVVSGILLIVVIMWVLANKVQKQKIKTIAVEKEKTDIEQKLFRSMMNPHFIFNTLGSIQSFLLNKGKSKDAAYYLTKFAKLMRQILVQSGQNSISLKEEINTLQNYLMLQKMRFENRFDFTIEVDDNIDIEEVMIPPMLLQPIVENSIEHGKIYKIDDGRIEIDFSITQNYLKAEIKDNGIGLNQSKVRSEISGKNSIAIDVIKKRLEFFKEKFDEAIGFDLRARSEEGTIATFTLPKF